MPSLQEWSLSKVADSSEALARGDGCHHDEARALVDYFAGSLFAQEASKQITHPVSCESDPPKELYRLWGLLCDGLVELSNEERQKTIELLFAIRTLPSTTKIDWSELPGFCAMWYDLHRLHIDGTGPWEHQTLTDDERAEISESFAAVGSAEAEMYVQGLEVPADWGYDVLNLVCPGRPGVEVFLSEVYAWLEVAGKELRESVRSAEKRRYSRPVAGSRRGEWRAVDGAMVEHWETWKSELRHLSGDRSQLSAAGRKLAAECLLLM